MTSSEDRVNYKKNNRDHFFSVLGKVRQLIDGFSKLDREKFYRMLMASDRNDDS